MRQNRSSSRLEGNIKWWRFGAIILLVSTMVTGYSGLCRGSSKKSGSSTPAPVQYWTKQLGSGNSDEAYGVATDTAGNIYVAGSTFGSLDGNTHVDLADIFVVKYTSAGVKQWTRQLGTGADDRACGVATDTAGNIYLAGSTSSGLDGNTSAGSWDLFVVKYNSDGVKQWTRQSGTSGSDYAYGVATDSGGNIYVAGSTDGELDGNTSAGLNDLFVVKYNSDGVKQWTRQLGSSDNDCAYGVATDTAGNIYVTGYTGSELDGKPSAGLVDFFVVRYTSDGVKLWTRQSGTSVFDYASGVATDSGGNIYVAGSTFGSLDGNTSAGLWDLFVVKYNSAGDKQWTRQLGTTANDSADDEAYGVATDSDGNIYVAGYTLGGLDGNTSAGGPDLFVVKYDPAGVKQWTRQSGTSASDRAYGVATDTAGNIYVTGSTGGGLDGNPSAGGADLFLVKYNSAGKKQ